METKLGKITQGFGLAVEVIICIEFLKEVYLYIQPRIKKCMARRQEDEQPLTPEEGGNADYEPEQ